MEQLSCHIRLLLHDPGSRKPCWRKGSGNADDVMDDKDVAEFLMENYGRPALLK